MTLVTVGMPVRNGGAMFQAALRSVLAQTHQNLEIIISDNGSDDETSEIARRAAAEDERVRYFRQEPPITAFDNFFFVLDAARGEAFMWAAHDDLRSEDYVSELLNGLKEPDTALCFGDLYISHSFGDEGSYKVYSFDNSRCTLIGRLRRQACMQCYHIYGLWRTSVLQRLPRNTSPWWPELPLMMSACLKGRFVYRPGPRFIYLEIFKSDAERAAQENYIGDSRMAYKITSLFRAGFKSARTCSGNIAALLTILFLLEKIWHMAVGKIARIWRVGDASSR